MFLSCVYSSDFDCDSAISNQSYIRLIAGLYCYCFHFCCGVELWWQFCNLKSITFVLLLDYPVTVFISVADGAGYKGLFDEQA